MTLQLIGRDLSPFVRRTATVIEVLGLPYERIEVATMTDPKSAIPYNPMARVPVLVLDSGEKLIDSWAIIDYLLENGDPEYALLPEKGEERRKILNLSAFAVAVMEKGVAGSYELKRRPAELIHEPWVNYIRNQISDGLLALTNSVKGKGWVKGGQPTLADINIVVAYDFISTSHSQLITDAMQPLKSLSDFANGHEAFGNTMWNG